jgi:tRNA(Ile)-lysidine synthase
MCESELRSLPEPLLIGVSGGIDSVALLHALVGQGRRPIVLHFNHSWRPESSADANWVRKLALELDLKFVAAKMRPTTKNRREAEARTARYAFFARTAKRLAIPHLVLAHQADDQVETFLLQLLRGAGAAGRGMDPLSERDGLILHRPWLGVWKKEIVAYAHRRHLTYRKDSTNLDTGYRRNLIRRRVLPYLQRQLSPQVIQNLWRAAEITRAESLWLDDLCREEIGQIELSVVGLRAHPLARQRRTLLRWLQARGVKDIGFSDVEKVRGLLEQDRPAKINLSAGKFARRRSGKIFIE